jgi:hypothetical protein
LHKNKGIKVIDGFGIERSMEAFFKTPPGTCIECGKEATTTCVRCGRFLCSKVCEEQSWREGTPHREKCKQVGNTIERFFGALSTYLDVVTSYEVFDEEKEVDQRDENFVGSDKDTTNPNKRQYKQSSTMATKPPNKKRKESVVVARGILEESLQAMIQEVGVIRGDALAGIEKKGGLLTLPTFFGSCDPAVAIHAIGVVLSSLSVGMYMYEFISLYVRPIIYMLYGHYAERKEMKKELVDYATDVLKSINFQGIITNNTYFDYALQYMNVSNARVDVTLDGVGGVQLGINRGCSSFYSGSLHWSDGKKDYKFEKRNYALKLNVSGGVYGMKGSNYSTLELFFPHIRSLDLTLGGNCGTWVFNQLLENIEERVDTCTLSISRDCAHQFFMAVVKHPKALVNKLRILRIGEGRREFTGAPDVAGDWHDGNHLKYKTRDAYLDLIPTEFKRIPIEELFIGSSADGNIVQTIFLSLFQPTKTVTLKAPSSREGYAGVPTPGPTIKSITLLTCEPPNILDGQWATALLEDWTSTTSSLASSLKTLVIPSATTKNTWEILSHMGHLKSLTLQHLYSPYVQDVILDCFVEQSFPCPNTLKTLTIDGCKNIFHAIDWAGPNCKRIEIAGTFGEYPSNPLRVRPTQFSEIIIFEHATQSDTRNSYRKLRNLFGMFPTKRLVYRCKAQSGHDNWTFDESVDYNRTEVGKNALDELEWDISRYYKPKELNFASALLMTHMFALKRFTVKEGHTFEKSFQDIGFLFEVLNETKLMPCPPILHLINPFINGKSIVQLLAKIDFSTLKELHVYDDKYPSNCFPVVLCILGFLGKRASSISIISIQGTSTKSVVCSLLANAINNIVSEYKTISKALSSSDNMWAETIKNIKIGLSAFSGSDAVPEATLSSDKRMIDPFAKMPSIPGTLLRLQKNDDHMSTYLYAEFPRRGNIIRRDYVYAIPVFYDEDFGKGVAHREKGYLVILHSDGTASVPKELKDKYHIRSKKFTWTEDRSRHPPKAMTKEELFDFLSSGPIITPNVTHTWSPPPQSAIKTIQEPDVPMYCTSTTATKKTKPQKNKSPHKKTKSTKKKEDCITSIKVVQKNFKAKAPRSLGTIPHIHGSMFSNYLQKQLGPEKAASTTNLWVFRNIKGKEGFETWFKTTNQPQEILTAIEEWFANPVNKPTGRALLGEDTMDHIHSGFLIDIPGFNPTKKEQDYIDEIKKGFPELSISNTYQLASAYHSKNKSKIKAFLRALLVRPGEDAKAALQFLRYVQHAK